MSDPLSEMTDTKLDLALGLLGGTATEIRGLANPGEPCDPGPLVRIIHGGRVCQALRVVNPVPQRQEAISAGVP
jgi:hypothetical protein